MPPIDRNEGYRRGAGKEGPSLDLAADFLRGALDLDVERIVDRDENFRLGDLRCGGLKATIEVKGQPIDPEKYGGKNFIEIFEDTSSGALAHHAGKLADVAERLQLTEAELAAVPVRRDDLPGRPTLPVGRLAHVSVSITPLQGAAAWIYVNNSTTMLYFYRSDQLLSLVRSAVRRDGFTRGQGGANSVTYAVRVTAAELRWTRVEGTWRYVGPGEASRSRAAALAILGAK